MTESRDKEFQEYIRPNLFPTNDVASLSDLFDELVIAKYPEFADSTHWLFGARRFLHDEQGLPHPHVVPYDGEASTRFPAVVDPPSGWSLAYSGLIVSQTNSLENRDRREETDFEPRYADLDSVIAEALDELLPEAKRREKRKSRPERDRTEPPPRPGRDRSDLFGKLDRYEYEFLLRVRALFNGIWFACQDEQPQAKILGLRHGGPGIAEADDFDPNLLDLAIIVDYQRGDIYTPASSGMGKRVDRNANAAPKPRKYGRTVGIPAIKTVLTRQHVETYFEETGAKPDAAPKRSEIADWLRRRFPALNLQRWSARTIHSEISNIIRELRSKNR
jgi:hypothetical protein